MSHRWFITGVASLCACLPVPSVGNTPPMAPERDAASGELRARTQFVGSTSEPIAEPFVDSRSLPRQLSIDPLSENEIQSIRESIYRRVKDTPPIDPVRHVAGADGCMQWVFQRPAPNAPWRTVGYKFADVGMLIKMNGHMRRVRDDIDIHYDVQAYASFGRLAHEAWRDGAELSITVFTQRDDPDEAARTSAADRQVLDDASFKRNGKRTRILRFGGSRTISIASSKAACSLMKAHCRRYEYTVDAPSSWWTWYGIEPHDGDFVRDPVAALQPGPMALAYEDMCPFARDALVERMRMRGGGSGGSVKSFGLPGNASLRDALRPYVRPPAEPR